jgi:hypothetical protein
MSNLGRAILEVVLDTNGLTTGLNNAKRTSETTLTGMERDTRATTGKMAASWREFVQQNLATYRQMEGNHAAAMKRLSAEWQAYKTVAVTANQQVAAAATSAASVTDRAVRATTGNIGAATSAFGGMAAKLTGLFAGGLVVGALGSLTGGMQDLANEADRAEKATGAYGRALVRFGQDVEAGNAMVGRLADRYGVLDTTVQQASTTLLRNGADLKLVEKALEAAGASALAQGTSVETAFDNVSRAIATGNSALLESSGLITNFGPVVQAYAKQVHKTVEELTPYELALARINALHTEAAPEIEEVSNAMAGLAGTNADAARESTKVRRELGEALVPVVITMQRAFTDVLRVTGSVITTLRDYPGVLAGVTTGVVALTAALAVNKVGGLGAALSALPGLAVSAGRSIALAFGPYGAAAIAIGFIAAAVAQVFADIRKADQERAALEAKHAQGRSQQASVNQAQEELNRQLEGRAGLLKKVRDAEEAYRQATDEWTKKRLAVEISAHRDTIRLLDVEIGKQRDLLKAKEAAAAKNAPKGNTPPAATGGISEALFAEAKRLVLAEQNAKTAQAIALARGELEKFTKASDLNKDAVDAVRESLQRQAQAAAAQAREVKTTTAATERATTAAENYKDRLTDLTGAFRDQVKDGQVSTAQVDAFRRSLTALERDAKQAGVTLPKAALDTARALIAQGDAAAKNADAAAAANEKAKAWADNLERLKYDRYVAGLTNYTDAQLKAALANAIAAKDVQKFNDVTAEQTRRLTDAAAAAQAAGAAALKVFTTSREMTAATRNGQNLLNDIARTLESGDPRKINVQLERLRKAMTAEWFGKLPGEAQAALKAQEEVLAAALTGFGDRVYARSTPEVEKAAARWANRVTNAAGEAITTSTRHLVPKAREVSQSLADAIGTNLPADLGKAISEGTALVTSDDFHRLPDSLQKAIKDGLERASKDYERWAQSLGAGVAVPYAKADPVTMGSDIYQKAKRAVVNATAALEAGTLTGEALASFGEDVRQAVAAADAVPSLFTAQQLQDIRAYAGELERVGDTLTRLGASQYAPGQVPKVPAPTQEELDRAERLAWLNGTTAYHSSAPKPDMLTDEELDRLERLEVITGHTRYAGTGASRPEVANLLQFEARLKAIEGMDLFADASATTLAVSFLEGLLGTASPQYLKDWATRLLEQARTALTAAEAGAWAEGTRKYGGTGQVFNPPLEPMANVEAREAARTAEMGARYAGTGQVYNPPLVALDSLEDLRQGYELGTVALNKYTKALLVEIDVLEATGDGSVKTKNDIARLRAELKQLNDADLLKTYSLIEGLGGQLSGIGSALSQAFGEDFDIAGRVLGAFGQITGAIPSMVQAFQFLAAGVGSAMNIALGWVGLVLQGIQLVLTLVGAFRPKKVEEADAPRLDTNAGFAFGLPDATKAPSISLNAPSASGFSYGAGTIQAANVMLDAAGIFRVGVTHFDAVITRLEARINAGGISTTGTNSLAFGV